jgi:hypothetical protein
MGVDEQRLDISPLSLTVGTRGDYLPLLADAVRDFALLAGFTGPSCERAARIAVSSPPSSCIRLSSLSRAARSTSGAVPPPAA